MRTGPFSGRDAVLATMHQKETVIEPVLSRSLGINITVPEDFDTDVFGTFSREIPRKGTQLETARNKAEAAMEQFGFDIGIASEGSFAPDPIVPFATRHIELVVLIDKKLGLELVGYAHSRKLRVEQESVSSSVAAIEIAKSWSFPDQGVLVRRRKNGRRSIFKDINTEEELILVVDTLLRRPLTNRVWLETDMRAHRAPARLPIIEAAASDLAKTCTSLCPACSAPGFTAKETVRGLPCSGCGLPTERPDVLLYACQKCGHTAEKQASSERTADPALCQWCNP